ncbi:MAG: HEAT repeat domain-containing protein [Cyclobacteriaceae bacterium]
MKLSLLLLLFSFCYSPLLSQSTEDFRREFKNAASSRFSDKELNRIFKEYSVYLTPHSDVTQLVGTLKGQSIGVYPLAEFKADPIYKNNISKLLRSKNPNKRILSYLVIAASGDLMMENELFEKIKTERNKNCLMWAGLALLHIHTTRTTVLFDFIVENENFDDMHMYPMLLKLNKDSLQQTAYSRINSKELKARILAAQILSNTPSNKKTEEVLLKAVSEWDINVKGYAIFSIKELQIGNLLKILKPLLENKQTRGIALEALANSPTKEDRDYLFGLVNSKDTIPSELLDCFIKSKNFESLTYWLELTHTKTFPKNYYFSSRSQPMLYTDTTLTYLHHALQKNENPEILDELVRALEGRTDSTSTDIMLRLLQNKNSNVRYWTANALKGNHSIKLIELLPQLLEQPAIRVVSMTELAIENKIDTLNSIYENILENDPNPDWRRSSLEYLSNFPKPKYISMFKELLENHPDDFYIQRIAALGLGRLRDASSVDLIISALRRESHTSDFNAISYLNALNLVKGDKAKIEIERFKDSKEKIVKELALDILNKW